MSLIDPREDGILSASRELLSCEIEESVLYDRTDGKHVEMSVAFIDMQDPLLLLGVRAADAPDNGEFEETLNFSMAEARLLRDLLNRPAVAQILDETQEHQMKRLPGFTLEEVQKLQKQLHS